jgi:KDO2-lipid IV(A) lauroyltransferase
MVKWIKNTLFYVLIRAVLVCVRLLSWNTSLKFGLFLGRRAFSWAKKDRQKALSHLAWAFPEKNEKERYDIAMDCFEHLGQAAVEVINAHKIKELSSWMEVDARSRQVMEAVFSRGKGVIFVTGHCGNWELMARNLAALGYPSNVIGKKSYDRRLTKLLQKFRDQGLLHTLWRGDDDLLERMKAVLRRGEFLGLLIDQDTNVPGVFVDFFNKKAWTPSIAGLLARQTGAAVVAGFNHRRAEGGYQVSVEEVPPGSYDDPEEALKEDTQVLTKKIEDHIRSHPGEWVWMHKRWKTRPKN